MIPARITTPCVVCRVYIAFFNPEIDQSTMPADDDMGETIGLPLADSYRWEGIRAICPHCKTHNELIVSFGTNPPELRAKKVDIDLRHGD